VDSPVAEGEMSRASGQIGQTNAREPAAGAGLNEASLSDAILGHAALVDVDSAWVKGLEAVHHCYPSIIGIDTL